MGLSFLLLKTAILHGMYFVVKEESDSFCSDACRRISIRRALLATGLKKAISKPSRLSLKYVVGDKESD